MMDESYSYLLKLRARFGPSVTVELFPNNTWGVHWLRLNGPMMVARTPHDALRGAWETYGDPAA